MVKEILENLSKLASDGRFEQHAREAHEAYERQAGAVYTDDKSYENRMTLFLEWFMLERPIDDSGRRILDVYHDEVARGSDAELAMVEALRNHVHDVFQVKSSKNGKIKMTGLFTDKTYVIDDDRADVFSKGEMFEARIVRFEKHCYLTNGFCLHPSGALKFIKAEMKRLRKSGGDGMKDFLFRLATMSVKYERSRQIDVNEIYK